MKRVILKDGVLVGFDDDIKILNKGKPENEVIHKRRVSQVLPDNPFLRQAFKMIRWAVKDESKAAEWTRSWGCSWGVVIDKVHRGSFSDRSKAIEFEKDFIYREGGLDRALEVNEGNVLPD